MSSLGLKIAKQKFAKDSHECVLLIESDANDAARILNELSSATDERFEVEWVPQLSVGIERLRNGGVGVVVVDLTLPDSHGIETFNKLFKAAPSVPVLILSGADTEAMARQAVQRGAQDYLIKNQVDGYRLRRAVRTMMDRRAASAMLLENEVANMTLDSIGEAVLRTDRQGNVVYLNRIAENMTGYPREEALGRPVGDVLRIIDLVSGTVVRNAVEIVMQDDKTARVTANCVNCILVRPDGVEIGIENTITPIHAEDGRVTGAVVAFHDVSVARARSLDSSCPAAFISRSRRGSQW